MSVRECVCFVKTKYTHSRKNTLAVASKNERTTLLFGQVLTHKCLLFITSQTEDDPSLALHLSFFTPIG